MASTSKASSRKKTTAAQSPLEAAVAASKDVAKAQAEETARKVAEDAGAAAGRSAASEVVKSFSDATDTLEIAVAPNDLVNDAFHYTSGKGVLIFDEVAGTQMRDQLRFAESAESRIELLETQLAKERDDRVRDVSALADRLDLIELDGDTSSGTHDKRRRKTAHNPDPDEKGQHKDTVAQRGFGDMTRSAAMIGPSDPWPEPPDDDEEGGPAPFDPRTLEAGTPLRLRWDKDVTEEPNKSWIEYCADKMLDNPGTYPIPPERAKFDLVTAALKSTFRNM